MGGGHGDEVAGQGQQPVEADDGGAGEESGGGGDQDHEGGLAQAEPVPEAGEGLPEAQHVAPGGGVDRVAHARV